MTAHYLKAMVKDILQTANQRKWTLQGFGMLRTYLPNDIRLHVWNKDYQVDNVSLIHDHPWSFESQIIAGAIRNTRYDLSDSGDIYAQKYMCRKIIPGEGLKAVSEDTQVWLRAHEPEMYITRDSYRQYSDEIHSSDYHDGTVTLVHRKREVPDVARVFWPHGQEWVSGEPRSATEDEVHDIVTQSLNMWFKD